MWKDKKKDYKRHMTFNVKQKRKLFIMNLGKRKRLKSNLFEKKKKIKLHTNFEKQKGSFYNKLVTLRLNCPFPGFIRVSPGF
jgi:hypothetical protein